METTTKATHTPLRVYRAFQHNDTDCFVVSRHPGFREPDIARFISEKDAILFIAAPALLEALRECITDDSACCMNTGQRERRLKAINAIARAAIARAEGGAA